VPPAARMAVTSCRVWQERLDQLPQVVVDQARWRRRPPILSPLVMGMVAG
jgi:hypothetical protein